MKKNKLKKVKTTKNVKKETIKYINEDTNQVKKFLILLFGIAIMAILLYFVTAKFLVKDNFQDNNNVNNEESIDYDKVTVGTMFNRPYDSYYILAYDSTSSNSGELETLKSNTMLEEKVYTLDLNEEVNKKHLSETGNKKATKSSEISLVSPTLVFIENGKITKYYEGYEKVKEILKK